MLEGGSKIVISWIGGTVQYQRTSHPPMLEIIALLPQLTDVADKATDWMAFYHTKLLLRDTTALPESFQDILLFDAERCIFNKDLIKLPFQKQKNEKRFTFLRKSTMGSPTDLSRMPSHEPRKNRQNTATKKSTKYSQKKKIDKIRL